jgi:hypothetical protein
MLSEVLERFSNPLIFFPVLFAFLSIIYSRSAPSPIPEDLPWIGKKSTGLFSETWAHFSSFNKVRKWLGDGYEKVLFLCLAFPMDAVFDFSRLVLQAQ